MARQSSQKFIERNRPPRVIIIDEVMINGSEKKVELPFVMGVMAGLSGKPEQPLPEVADRKALEIDVDNFNERLKSMKPRVRFNVPNKIGDGQGEQLVVDITFASMDDFSPAEVAGKVAPLRKLLEARTELKNLSIRLDGKSDVEKLIQDVLGNRPLLEFFSAPSPAEQA